MPAELQTQGIPTIILKHKSVAICLTTHFKKPFNKKHISTPGPQISVLINSVLLITAILYTTMAKSS